MISSEFGAYLRGLRKDRNLTLKELKGLTGISHSYLSQVETGVRGTPSPEYLRLLYKPLDVTYEELMEKAGYSREKEEELEQALIEFKGYDLGLDKKIKDVFNNLTNDETVDFYQFLKDEVHSIFEYKYKHNTPKEILSKVLNTPDLDLKDQIFSQLKRVYMINEIEIEDAKYDYKEKKRKELQALKLMEKRGTELSDILKQPGITYQNKPLNSADKKYILDTLKFLFRERE